MLFKFLKYLHPIWYPNLDLRVFVSYEDFPPPVKAIIDLDNRYISEGARRADAAFQAWHKGLIQENYARDFKDNNWPLEDEYRFIRKYFNPVWYYYVLLIRLSTLNNPIKEIRAFIRGKETSQVKLFDQVYTPIDYEEFKSDLILSKPLVSVIIPTLNRYDFLKDVLFDLCLQDYKNIEVIIIDQSDPYKPSFYEEFDLNIKLFRQEEKALWYARNHAVRESSGEYVLLFDDDSRVEPDWITQHLKCLDYFKADISSGVSLSTVGARIPENYYHFRWADQLDTGNVMLKKSTFKKTGLFDRQFEKQRMGDGEFGLRCYLNGLKNISNPLAKRIHLKGGTGGLREMGSWDGYRAKSLFSPRPIPSVLYFFRRYFGLEKTIYMMVKNIPGSVIPYKFKRSFKLKILGYFITLLIFPVILIQIWVSWKKSSKMIEKGPLIDRL